MDVAAEKVFGLLGGDEIAHGRAAGVHPLAHAVERTAIRRTVANHDERLQAREFREPRSHLLFAVLAGRVERSRTGVAEPGDVVSAKLHAPAVKIVEAEPRAER